MSAKLIRLALALAVLAIALVALFWPAINSLRSTAFVGAPVQITAPVPPGRDQWVAFAGSEAGGQYSSLQDINRGNVADLQVAWRFATGTAGTRTTPIHVNDSLYLCNSKVEVMAIDPATGTQRWRTDVDAAIGDDGANVACKAVAYWRAASAGGAPCDKRLFVGDGRARLYALDADTGALCADFGNGGYVALQDFEYYGEGPMTLPSPPAIYADLVIVGSAMPDNVDNADVPDGIVRALDVRTGAQVWEFNPIPESMREATGAANVWAMFAVDAQHGIVYLPTTSPSLDGYGASRTQEIPLANAVVALRADTGELLWHYQTVHHDLFEMDLPAQPILFDRVRDGQTIPALAQITKSGLVFLFNRLTGEPLFPIEERAVPQSDVPGEVSSPTQPFPVLPEPFARQRVSREEMFGLTWIDRRACQKQLDGLRNEGPFTPASLQGSLQLPSPIGGGNWGGAALDPARQLLVVRATNLGIVWRLKEVPESERRNLPPDFYDLRQPMYGTPYEMTGGALMGPFGVPCTPPPWGTMTAIDLVTGRTVWHRPVGRAHRNGMGAPEVWGSPMSAGPMVTAGGLVFMGAVMDNHLRAFDVDSGKTLWQGRLPAPGMAVPMTYRAQGRQFVVVAAGGWAPLQTDLADELVAFALPER